MEWKDSSKEVSVLSLTTGFIEREDFITWRNELDSLYDCPSYNVSKDTKICPTQYTSVNSAPHNITVYSSDQGTYNGSRNS